MPESSAPSRTAVHFGAGVIGRGFIADLLSRSGYRMVFVDVDPGMVGRLNEAGEYRIRSLQSSDSVRVQGISALCTATDHDAIVDAIAAADLVTTSVWADNLPGIAGVISEGLGAKAAGGGEPINVIACENAVGASTRLHDLVEAAHPDAWRTRDLASVASFPNSSVHRMVFRPAEPESLDVLAADSHELAIARNQLVDPAQPPIEGAVYSDNIAAHVERKLHIINCGHAIAGYLAAYNGWDDPRESFVRPEALAQVRAAMNESAAGIAAKHGFDSDELDAYVSSIVTSFQIPRAQYRIQDVARSPMRKLAPSDRLVGPATYCEEHGLPNDHLVTGIALALLYRDPNDAQAVQLQERITQDGIPATLQEVAGIHADSDLSRRIGQRVDELASNRANPTHGKDA